MVKRKYRTFEEAQVEYYKKHPGELKDYLKAALEEYQKDGDEKAFLCALSVVAKIKGGFTKLAKDTGLNRENLYRALSKHHDPKFSTIINVLESLGYSLKIA